MVGVPGRSKGCNTCRKRHIACSLERPSCQQCVKSKRDCPGYQKDRIFVTSTVSPQESGKPWRQSAYQASLPRTKSSLSPNASTTSLARTAAKRKAMGTVLDGFDSALVLEGNGSHWLSKVSGQSLTSEALETSILALCLARLARSSADDATMFERMSAECYGSALCEVRQALGNPKKVYEDETLAACLVLAMFEVLECPGLTRTAYEKHLYGCARLVELRGPEAYQNGMAHSIFLAFRTMGALEALVRRRTFLSKPEWRTVPFAQVTKSHFDVLVDIILDGPALMVRAAQLEELRSTQAVLVETASIVRSCKKIITDLRQLYYDMHRSGPDLLYWSVPSKLDGSLRVAQGPDCNRDLFPLQYEFTDIRTAITLALHWGVLVLVQSSMGHLIDLMRDLRESELADAATPALPLFSDDADFMPAARHVCQSVQYCMQHEIGLPFMMAPLNMVIQTLKARPGHELEVGWAQRALQLVRRKGVHMADYLPQDEEKLHEELRNDGRRHV